MKYNKRDNNVYQIRLENEDDLYHLNLLLSEGDQVRALTERRESSQSDRLKSERGKKQKMMLTIDVKTLNINLLVNDFDVTESYLWEKITKAFTTL